MQDPSQYLQLESLAQEEQFLCLGQLVAATSNVQLELKMK